MGLGFFFDQSLCTGCKACQVACKDKHELPDGIKWRRVVEYAGATWQNGDTVRADVFTYYTSVACNHCEDPICVKVCPTTAMTKRADGTVFVDQTKCVGCRYCEWACPYSAPQFDAALGHMTKCDGCKDYRDQGLSPACVASCPSRALEWGDVDQLQAKHGSGGAVTAPLPDPSLTKPNLTILPNRAAQQWNAGTGQIMNPQEI